jgi:hypothetical protein
MYLIKIHSHLIISHFIIIIIIINKKKKKNTKLIHHIYSIQYELFIYKNI